MKGKNLTPKGEMDNLTIVAGEFNNSLTGMDTTARQKINKDIEDLKNINHLD